MNALHPLIEELADATGDAERAAWLLACPFNQLMTYSTTIANRLHLAGFAEGAAYLDMEIAVGRSRRECGLIIKDNPLRTRMMEIAGYILAGD